MNPESEKIDSETRGTKQPSWRRCVRFIRRIAVTGSLLFVGASSLALAQDKPKTPPAAPSTTPAPSGITLPAESPLERYQPMLDQSPFALATQAAPPPVTDSAGFSKDLVLTGIARLSQGEFVSISSRDQSQRFGLMTGESYNGITVASVAWSDAIGKTKVTLKQGSEYGVIGFDEATLANTNVQPPTGGSAAITGQPNGAQMPNNRAFGHPPGAVAPPAAVNPTRPGGPPARRRILNAPSAP